MEHQTGFAMVYRGAEALGQVQYRFDLPDDGRVAGWIVDVELLPIRPVAGRVPDRYLPGAVVETDLHLSLNDGKGRGVPDGRHSPWHHRNGRCSRGG
jgi:hypothetical protein